METLQAARMAAIKFVSDNLINISEIRFISEDENRVANFADLQEAINFARESELAIFPKTHRIPYDGGCLKIKLKN